MSILKKLCFLLFLIWGACDIISDDDITTMARLDDLKLTSFDIVQHTSKGSSTLSSTLLADSAVSISTGTGQTINRIVWYSVPGLGSLKLKYRSGANSNLRTYTSYFGDNQPYTFVLYQGDSAVEIYRFRYDVSGKLNRIVTDINPVDGLPLLSRTNDTIIYNSATEIGSIIRRSPDESRRGTFSFEYGGFGNTARAITRISFQSINLQPNWDNCPNGSGNNFCMGFNYQAPTPPNDFAMNISKIGLKLEYSFDKLMSLKFLDRKLDNNGGTCCYDYDTYYFHPTMLLREYLTNGADLMNIYMIDWWQVGPRFTGNANFTTNDEVTLNLNYGL